ncbi:hypothetical protein O0I10_006918 [Lichtheimia ornata]|uniref:Uncharacterized protein n=1 Tax=Lichtheimia ornata TaxID=688661 RepID=A0AAD7XUE2_9FUNG|nr:uncharacterized protein O0I10_006918 [Lichtheimia ornata]KAJ8657364.1 hypothetical protein O0I10_006918 [Lichtheimia ornata]
MDDKQFTHHHQQQRPPTPAPSSSAASQVDGLRLSLPKAYGSFMSTAWGSEVDPMMVPSDHSVPSTPPHTTVSENDNEEGLYLLWTHQILRDRGMAPHSCNGEVNDSDDDGSSITQEDYYMDTQATTPHRSSQEASLSSPLSFSSMIDTCFGCFSSKP